MKHSEVRIMKSVRQSTGEKRYIPYVNNKPLLLSWTKRTLAEVYGNRVFERYIRLLMAKTAIIKK